MWLHPGAALRAKAIIWDMDEAQEDPVEPTGAVRCSDFRCVVAFIGKAITPTGTGTRALAVESDHPGRRGLGFWPWAIASRAGTARSLAQPS